MSVVVDGKKMIEAEVADAFVNVVKKQAELRAVEHLNRTASALKAEYLDLVSIKDEEMTVELGENLRCQMFEIFRILKKQGIDVESRIH